MNQLAIVIAVVLLPGLIAAIICDKLIAHSVKWDAFKYAIYSFLFGVISYFFLQILKIIAISILRGLCIDWSGSYKLGIWAIIKDPTASIPLIEVAFATCIAPLIAFAATTVVTYKLINKFAQKLGISYKYGDENLFSYFLNAPDFAWVYLRDQANGFTYRGIVESFSECDSIQEIVLYNVTVYDYGSSKELYQVDKIYLAKPLGSFVIEVPKSDLEEK